MNLQDVKFDHVKWRIFCDYHSSAPDTYKKYFDLYAHISRHLAKAELMRLVEGKRPMRILDISAGVCAFPLICRSLRHSVKITDCDDPIFNATQATLGFWTYYHSYKTAKGYKYVRLPEGLCNNHLITAFACSPMSHWDIMDWKYFISNCMENLVPGGCVYIEPNVSPGCDSLFEYVTCLSYPTEINNKKGVVIIWKNE